MKLLGLLPIGAGTIISLLLKSEPNKLSLVPLGVLGAAVTGALFFYELIGILRCERLITIGAGIEKALGQAGQFASLPEAAQGAGFEVAACIIYSAVVGVWIAVAMLFFLSEGRALVCGAVV